eukprot:5927732-Alexandrium_andersonii.AAC.1
MTAVRTLGGVGRVLGSHTSLVRAPPQDGTAQCLTKIPGRRGGEGRCSRCPGGSCVARGASLARRSFEEL